MQKTSKPIFIAITCAIILAIVYLLAPVLTPFMIAALLAYLGDPLVDEVKRLGVPRIVAVILVFLGFVVTFVLIILLLIPLIQKQLVALTEFLPKILEWSQNQLLPWLAERFDIQEIVNVDVIKKTISENWAKAGGALNWTFKTALQSGLTLIEWVTNLVLIPVVTFYLLRDWKKIINSLHDCIPREYEKNTVQLAKECDSVLSAFLRGQFIVMVALGMIYSVGLMMIGLKIGLILGLLAGLASIVPYLGFIVGIISASIAAFIQFGTLGAVGLVLIVFAVGQFLESFILTPKLVGNRIGLHPVAVIFAILAGGYLFGFFGILLALPVAAIMMVLLRHMHKRYLNSHLYKAKT